MLMRCLFDAPSFVCCEGPSGLVLVCLSAVIGAICPLPF